MLRSIRKIGYLKSTLYAVLFSLFFSITGCSYLGSATSAVGGIFTKTVDAVLWLPRKLARKSTDFYDKRVSGVPPDWQQDIELGQPRKPIMNPGGSSYDGNQYIPSEPTQYPYPPSSYGSGQQQPSAQPYGQQPLPDSYEQQPSPSFGGKAPQSGGSAPAYMQDGYGSQQQQQYQQPSYGKPSYQQQPSFQPAPSPTQPQSKGGSTSKDINSYLQAPPPMPVAPWEKDKSNFDKPSDGSQSYQGSQTTPYSSYTGSGSGFDPDDATNMSGFKDGKFAPPSYNQLQQTGGDPFAPIPTGVQYKYVRVFEPMADEFYADGTVVKEIKTTPKGQNRSESMFPLKEYAPKGSVNINEFASVPQRKTPITFKNKEAVDAKIDELIVKLGEADATKYVDEENTKETAANNSVQQAPKVDNKAVSLPKNIVDNSNHRVTKADAADKIKPINITPLSSEQIKKFSSLPIVEPQIVGTDGVILKNQPAVADNKAAADKTNNTVADNKPEVVENKSASIDKKDVVAENKTAVADNKQDAKDEFKPIDITPVAMVSSNKLDKPLLELPKVSDLKEAKLSFKEPVAEVAAVEPAEEDNSSTDEAPEIAKFTPTKAEYIPPPVVNIKKPENISSYSQYSVLPKSRYSDRRGGLE